MKYLAGRALTRTCLTLVSMASVAAACTGQIDPDAAAAGGGGNGAPVGGNGPRPGQGGQLNQGGESGQDAAPALVPSARFVRLTHRQWEATVRDLLALPRLPALADTFTGDPVGGRFENGAKSLQVTEGLWRDYAGAADRLARQATEDATTLAALLPADLPADPTARKRAFVERFGRRAFRRPLTDAELNRYVTLFDRGSALTGGTDAFRDGVRIVIEALLQSPFFLYRTELGAGDGPIALDDWELAAKLAYALTGTMPDDALFAAAEAGRLHEAADVRTAATRLLGTPGARAMLDDFHNQLLRMKSYDAIEKDTKAYPAFTTGIGAEMREETLSFAREVFESGGGVEALLSAPFSFVNEKLAKIYGVEGVTGTGLRRVSLDPAQRAGLLTHVGFLAANAHSHDVDSIHRGVFVHLNVLCNDLPPPAENVPPVPSGSAPTNRERVTLHTGKGTCGAGCHSDVINPAGFAFEQYGALGEFRTKDNGVMVDASGAMDIDDERVSWTTGVEFVRHLARSHAAHECYARSWLEYLHGRGFERDERPWLAALAETVRAGTATLEDMVLALVTSEAFRKRLP